MPDFADIRSGLAANLSAIPDFQISNYLLDSPADKCLQVAGLVGYEQLAFGDGGGKEYTVEIEVCLARSSDIGPQKWLDKLLAESGDYSVEAALKADRHLTSRRADDGTITEDEDEAAAYVRIVRFKGGGQHTLPNGVRAWLGSWVVQVGT